MASVSFTCLGVDLHLLLQADISTSFFAQRDLPLSAKSSKDMVAVWAGSKGWRWFQLKIDWTWSYEWHEWDENIISITGTRGGWVAGPPLTLTEVEDKLYCKRCWKDYGWYIKNGPPYTLSLHLDRLARKHGVRIVEVNVGKGKAKGKGFLSHILGWLMGKYGKVRS